jgi:hypothetical protein
MRTALALLGLSLLTVAFGLADVAGQDTKKPADGPKKQPVEEPKELSVVDYESKTRGALQVMSVEKNPGDWFDVRQNGKRAFPGVEPRLNGTLELPPGAYVVIVNKTERKVNIEAGKKTVLLTGDLMVQSRRKGTFWVPKQGKETRLASNPPIVCFPANTTRTSM